MGKFLWDQPVEDRDALMHRVLLFPGGCLHLLEAAAHDDCHGISTEPAGRAAAIHRCVAAAEHNDASANFVDMPEGDAREPVDTNMDVLGRLIAAGDVEIAAARSPATDKDRIPIVAEQSFQAFDILSETGFDTHFEDQVAFFVS